MPETETERLPTQSRAERHAAERGQRASRRPPRPAAPRPARPPRRRHPVLTALVAVVLVCVVVVLAAAYALFLKPNHPALSAGSPVSFVVEPGASSTQIATNLKQAGLIDNPTIFRFRLLRAGAGTSLKAGTHQLVSGWSYERIIDELRQSSSGPGIKVTIPEGSSIAQIGAILQSRLGLSASDFEAYASSAAPDYAKQYPFVAGAYNNSLEGFLFPDTYEFPKGITAPDACAQMLARFSQVWSQFQSQASASGYSTAQLVTIASLVEKEVSVPEERVLVSSVIYNRLNLNMKLQLCSTVQFLLPGPAKNKLRLTDADLATPSPYNTYLHSGLPPGPIANPGTAALTAALQPAKTTYLYFVLTGKDGSQTFASTPQQFAAAKQKSKEVFGQ